MDVLLLGDEDMETLKLKLSDPTKWDLAIEDLKGNMRVGLCDKYVSKGHGDSIVYI